MRISDWSSDVCSSDLAGTKELLVISQDTSAYGVDIKHFPRPWHGEDVRAHMTDLSRELGKIAPWVRLHYVYPYPHVDQVIPLMAEGQIGRASCRERVCQYV